MESTEFLDFLETIQNGSRELAAEINSYLPAHGCKREIKTAKSGYTVSYIRNETKKTLATFVCRKTGVKLRIFPQYLEEYEEFLNTAPDKLKKEFKKASPCKRLADPDACNPKCGMGYEFNMDNERHQKCRYMAFMPTLNQENMAFIKSFLENEIQRHPGREG